MAWGWAGAGARESPTQHSHGCVIARAGSHQQVGAGGVKLDLLQDLCGAKKQSEYCASAGVVCGVPPSEPAGALQAQFCIHNLPHVTAASTGLARLPFSLMIQQI